jgi:hypothetical protein
MNSAMAFLSPASVDEGGAGRKVVTIVAQNNGSGDKGSAAAIQGSI